MKTHTSVGLTALAASLGFAAGALATPLVSQSHLYNSSLSKLGSKLGKAVTYPIKKGAGNGSKAVNHGAKSVEYPVRKSGVNTSKTTHKVLPK